MRHLDCPRSPVPSPWASDSRTVTGEAGLLPGAPAAAADSLTFRPVSARPGRGTTDLRMVGVFLGCLAPSTSSLLDDRQRPVQRPAATDGPTLRVVFSPGPIRVDAATCTLAAASAVATYIPALGNDYRLLLDLAVRSDSQCQCLVTAALWAAPGGGRARSDIVRFHEQ